MEIAETSVVSNDVQVSEVPRNGRQMDLVGAASGYGGGYCCDTGVDLPTLLAILAGKINKTA